MDAVSVFIGASTSHAEDLMAQMAPETAHIDAATSHAASATAHLHAIIVHIEVMTAHTKDVTAHIVQMQHMQMLQKPAQS